MRTAAKVDGNQPEIVETARDMGASVAHTHQLGKGFPDLVLGLLGLNLLWEVKMPGGKLTGDEPEFHASWRGQIVVVDSVEKAEQEIVKWREIALQLKGLE